MNFNLTKTKSGVFRALFLQPWILALTAMVCFGVTLKIMAPLADGSRGPGITDQTWPAGTFLSHIDRGGRVVTFHRGYAYMNGITATSVWDVSNPANPVMLDDIPVGSNGHRWWKMGDMFWREYDVPEVEGSGYQFLDLSNMLNRVPWTRPSVIPIEANQPHFQDLETFPHTLDGNNVYDMRSEEFITTFDFSGAPRQDLKIRIGNLLIFFGAGAATYDIGDPANIKLLDVLTGDYNQYTTTYQIWRNYLLFLNGDNSNEGGNNLVAIDFSDPADLQFAFGIPFEDTPGRYMFFQDEYGFTGRQEDGVKINLATREVEVRFKRPDHPLSFSDFQWIPLGHILMASGAESGNGQTFFFSHQDELDENPPYVSYHNPVSGAVNQPLTTVVGFVINETLDDLTINNETVQVRPINGDPIPGDIVSTSYDVFNFAPSEPLEPNTTYEVRLIEGGIRDVAGNGIEETVFYFSTGGGLEGNAAPEISEVTNSAGQPVPSGTPVTFSVQASDADSDDLLYRWDFGDGQPKTDFTAEPDIVHVFDQPGVYQVFVQATDNKEIAGGFTSLIVTASVAGAFPTQSGQVAIDEANRKVWTVNPDNNTVAVIDADDGAKIDEIPVGDHPTGLAVAGNGSVWVACRDADKIYVLNGGNGNVEDIIDFPRGSRPFEICFTPDGETAYISEFGSGTIAKAAMSSRSVLDRLPVGPTPRALAISGDGEVLLATRFISPDDAGKVWKIDLNSFSLETVIDLPIDDFTKDSGSNGRGLPNYLAGVAIHPTTQKAWVVGKKDNILRGLKTDGRPFIFENMVRNAISTIDLSTDQELLQERIDIDDHAQPSSVSVSPLGSHLFLTMQGNNRIIVLDAHTGEEITRMNAGLSPQGLAIDQATGKVFVKNFMSRDMSIIDASEMLSTGSRQILNGGSVSTVASEKLPSQVLKGKQIFYNSADTKMGQDGYISCAVCHIDGTEDGRVWDFTDRGEGMRNTIALTGRAGTGHGRVHWTANFDEIQDFEHDMRSFFSGTGFMSDADFNTGTRNKPLGQPKAGASQDLDALAAYLESLDAFGPSPHRNNDGTLTADGVAGKALFMDLNCGSCHSGDAFTDSNKDFLHDVGTINDNTGRRASEEILGLDAPTLRDVWATAPYLHDGSAATLRDVLTTRNMNGAHGDMASLSSSQIDQLAAYLKQIDGSEPAAGDPHALAITTPEDGAVILDQMAIPLTIDTNIPGIERVLYYANGEVIAEATESPFSGAWTPVKWESYIIQAKVFYNGGKTATVSPEITIQYKDAFEALMVVGDTELSLGDQIVRERLEERGFQIEVIDDDVVTNQDGRLKDIIFVSSTVTPSSIGEDLTHIPTPVFSWDPFSYSFLRLTGHNYNDDFGFTQDAISEIEIVKEGHPMAAGKSGAVKIYNIVQRLPFGVVSGDLSVVIAEAGGAPVIFGNEQGGDSYSQARKVAFPLRGDFIHLFSPEGWDLFDAAIDWALYGGDETTGLQPLPDVRIVSPEDGATVGPDFDVVFNLDNFEIGPQGNQVHLLIDGNHVGSALDLNPVSVTNLTTGSHEVMVQLLREGYGRINVKHTIQVVVSDDPVENPGLIIHSPENNAVVQTPFELQFSALNWEMEQGGRSVHYFIDDMDMGALYNDDPVAIGNVEPGTHTLTLKLAEPGGVFASVEAAITVQVAEAVNNPPVVQIAASTTSGPPPLTVDFDAAASSDPEGDELSFSWEFGDGGSGSGTTISHVYETVGTYRVVVTADDGNGGLATGEITIHVNDEPNNPPVAMLSANPKSGEAPLAVAFDASGSSDADGDELICEWDFGDGTTGSGENPQHTYSLPGTYQAEVIVSDGKGGIDQAQVEITVTTGSGGGCDFGTPLVSGLPSINGSYSHVHTLGSSAPELSHVNNFTINWSLENNGLWQFSMNTTNGQPNWYVDLRTVSEAAFAQDHPQISISGSGFPGLDGNYYAAIDGANFVLVSTSADFVLYFSNSPVPPDCGNSRRWMEQETANSISVYPNPSTGAFSISLGYFMATEIGLFDMTGKEIERMQNLQPHISIGEDLQPGIYLLRIVGEESALIFKLEKL